MYLVTLLLMLYMVSRAQEPMFKLTQSYSVGSGPNSVLLANFDNDEINDIVVTNHSSHDFSVLLSYGDGSYFPATNYSTQQGPNCVCAVDLNSDGHRDLAITGSYAHSGSFVSISFNAGDGTFLSPVTYYAANGSNSICYSDFDNDGDPDLAVGNVHSGSVSILLNNGDGSFLPTVNYPGGGYALAWIITADIDNDSDSDLITVNSYTDIVYALFNNGDATFQEPVGYTVGNNPSSVAAADYDSDGDVDLAVSGFYSHDITVLSNDGSGDYQIGESYGGLAYPLSIRTADFDLNGYPDLAVGNKTANTISVLLNDGSGTFEDPLTFNAGGQVLSIYPADIESDGDVDIVIVAGGEVALCKNMTKRPPSDLWVDIVGRDVQLYGSTEDIDIYIGNYGYENAYDVLLMIGTHYEASCDLNLSHPPNDTIDWDSLSDGVLIDDTLMTYPVYLSRISPDSVCCIRAALTAPLPREQESQKQLSALSVYVRFAQVEARACAETWRGTYQYALETNGIMIHTDYQVYYEEYFNELLRLYRIDAVIWSLVDVALDIGLTLLGIPTIFTGPIGLASLQASCYEWQAYVDECWWREQYYQTFLKNVRLVNSWDPNDKCGPTGFDTLNHYVPPEQLLNYKVYFENVDSASADAENIVIVDTLSANLDWNTLTFGQMSHPQVCEANFDSESGVITWSCDSIMLPPNTNPPDGEGWVSYSIKPLPQLSTGTIISNHASIKFDYNPWIYAPMDSSLIIATIDADAPTSAADPLSTVTNSLSFMVTWGGSDDPGGSGIASYTIFVRDGEGPYEKWLSNTNATSEIYNGEPNHTYYFYSIATDNVGHIEERPQSHDASTTIDWIPTCGDANSDQAVNVADAVFLINYVFKGGPEPVPVCIGDANGDGVVNIGDAVYLIAHIFSGGPPPVEGCCP
jgi:hypothetical protein